MRIVSLLPAATEIVFALGLAPVGGSHECNHPSTATVLPSVTRSRVNAASTGEVNAQVEAAVSEYGSVFSMDTDRLDALDPDLIVTQGTCEVCAVDASVVHEATADYDSAPRVLEIDPHTLDDVFDAVRRIGSAAGVPDRSETLVADLRGRIDAVEARLPPDGHRPSVAILDWLDPLMVAGHWVPETVEQAGGRFDLSDPGSASQVRDWTEIRAYDPDVLIAAPCGLSTEATLADIDELADRPGWPDLTAVADNRVYAVDGHDHLNRPGPRLIEMVESLAGLLHPDRFPEPPDDIVRPVPGGRPSPNRS